MSRYCNSCNLYTVKIEGVYLPPPHWRQPPEKFFRQKGANVDKAILNKDGKPRHPSGLKVGQKHRGQFKAGHDPRRNQHDKDVKAFRREFTAKLSEASEDVAQFLLDTMRDSGAPAKVRLHAANNIMDRILGKPVSYAAVAVQTETSNTHEKDLSTLSDSAILKLLDNSGALGTDLDAGAVDGEFMEVLDQQAESPSEASTEPLSSRRRRGRARPTETNQEAEQ